MQLLMQPKLTDTFTPASFDPHLLLSLHFVQPHALNVLLSQPGNDDMHFLYNGKACKFSYHILNGHQPVGNNQLQMAIELVNPTLHYGQFAADNHIELTFNGRTVAKGSIAEVLDPNFLYWDVNNLPSSFNNKKPVVSKETLKTFLLNLEFDLLGLDFIEDYEIKVDKEAGNLINVQLWVPNKTVTLLQAQKLEKIFAEMGFGNCYYKAGYVPFSLGLLDILMQNYTAAFAAANKKNYITGLVEVV